MKRYYLQTTYNGTMRTAPLSEPVFIDTVIFLDQPAREKRVLQYVLSLVRIVGVVSQGDDLNRYV